MLAILTVGAGLTPSWAGDANVIVPNGRTQTTVQTSGNLTNITTSTVSGPNAFNSFSQFGVGKGNTVNLLLPSGTQNLINTVTEAQAYINGTVNSYVNGKIGGNVYFADPKGFVVGPSGVVNVGSLNVSTPTRAFVDSIYGPQGQINNAAVNNLVNGSYPVSLDGNIRILGRVNAADGVRLTGQNVAVGGQGTREHINQVHAAEFAASVNSKGLHSANAIIVRNGSIQIVAANNAKVSGRLAARGKASSISVTAGKDIYVEGAAKLSSSSTTGDAGNITLKAGGDLIVASGATVNASSAMSNAGLVELSANGAFKIGEHVTINLGAPNGQKGTLTLDPTDIVIGDASQGDSGVTMSNATVANAISALSNGSTFQVIATNSLTLDPHAVVDTRRLSNGVSAGDAFNISLQASTISVQAGAQVLAQPINAANTTYAAGSVTLLSPGSSGSITVAGTLSGGFTSILSGGPITFAPTAVASTQVLDSTGSFSVGNSQNLVASGSTINVMAGSQITTTAINAGGTNYNAGNLFLNAFNGSAGAITVAGTASGANVNLFATGSITIASTGVVGAWQVTNANQDVTYGAIQLTAPTISVASGAQLTAQPVYFNIQQDNVIIGDQTVANSQDAVDASKPGFLSNSAIASYVAAIGSSGTIQLGALQSITIDPNGKIDTRRFNATTGFATDNPVGIALTAPSITVANGGQLLASVVNDVANNLIYAPGDVILTSVAASLPSGSPTPTGITVAGLIKGGNVTLSTDVAPVTITATGIIDTRQADASGNSTASPRNITLTTSSSNIVVAAGAQLLAAGANAVASASSIQSSPQQVLPGTISLVSPGVISVGAGTLNGAVVFEPTSQSGTVYLGSTAGFIIPNSAIISNSVVANWIAGVTGGTSSITLLSSSSGEGVRINAGAVIDATQNSASPALVLRASGQAAAIVISGGATVSGASVTLDAGSSGVISIDITPSSGATVSASSLHFNASVAQLSSSASTIFLGGNPASVTGAITNSSIAAYVTAMGGSGELAFAAASTIQVVSNTTIDLRQQSNGVATGNSISLGLNAPSIYVFGQIRGDVVNQNGTTYTPGNVVLQSSGAPGSGAINVLGTIKAGSISLIGSLNSVLVGAFALLDTRQLDLAGNSVGPAGSIAFQGSGIQVSNTDPAAGLYASNVSVSYSASFASGLTIGGGSLSGGDSFFNDGTNGLLSNFNIAGYLGAIKNGGTLQISSVGALTLNSDARINSAGSTNIKLAAQQFVVNAGALISAPIVNWDPSSIVVGAASDPNSGRSDFQSNAQIAGMVAATAGTFQLSASSSITIDSSGTIATVAGSGATSIALSAASITVNGTLDASASGGDITLTASAGQNLPMGPASANLGVTIAGTLKGRNIDVEANATANSSYKDSALSFTSFAAQSVVGAALGINGGYLSATSTAAVSVQAGANISGTGSVTLRSVGAETVADPIISIASSVNQAVAAAVVVGELSGSVTTSIASGATIHSGGKLTVAAQNTATASLSAIAVTRDVDKSLGAATVAFGTGTVNTTASIANGATLSVGSLDLFAYNTNSFSVSASTFAFGSAKVSASVAYSQFDTHATATLGSSFSSPGDVNVVASSNTIKNKTSAGSTTGTGAVPGLVLNAVPAAATKVGLIDRVAAGTGNNATPKAALTVSFAQSEQSAEAAIASALPTSQVITSNGNVTVVSNVIDSGLHNIATSSVESESKKPTNANPQATLEISAAVGFGEYGHDSNAYIGPNVTINAGRIGVNASTTIPLTNSWLDWAGVPEVLSHLNPNLGVANDILTTYTNANGGANKAALNGSVNYFSVANNTTAWVGSGAKLTATNASSASWQTTTPVSTTTDNAGTTTTSGGPGQIAWASGLTVTASTSIQTIDVAGNVGALGLLPGNAGQGADSTSAGGAVNLNLFSTTTTAGIGDGAIINANGGLTVSALTNDIVFAVAPTSGSGAGLGINGASNIIQIDNTTHASISNLTQIDASSVAVTANQGMSVLSAVGAINKSNNNGVGLSLAIAFVNTDTQAYVGANSTDITANGHSADATQDGTLSNLTGHLTAPQVTVDATTYGTMSSLAVAMTVVSPSPPSPSFTDRLKSYFSKPNTSPAPGPSGAGGAAGNTVATDSAADTSAKGPGAGVDSTTQSAQNGADSAGGGGPGSSQKLSLAVAGSGSVTSSQFNTKAYIVGATPSYAVKGANGGTLGVQALTDVHVANDSGAAAFDIAGNKSKLDVAVAGAVAVGLSDNTTLASISNATITQFNTVTAQALSGGVFQLAGLALSVASAPLQGGGALAIAGSASVALVTDQVNATIADSSIVGTGHSSDRVNVYAYQNTDIGIGAGSLYISKQQGNNGGLGFSATYAQITDPSNAATVSAQVTNTAISNIATLDVDAVDASVIIAGGATVGVAPGGFDVGGALVITDVAPTITASIGGSASSPKAISVSGGIFVRAGTLADFSVNLDQVLANTITSTGGSSSSLDTGVDFTGGGIAQYLSPDAITGSLTPGGAAIIGVAGIVQVGGGNVGASVAINTIEEKHSASVADVTLTAPGGITVLANDATTIIGTAAGVGVSAGQAKGFALVGVASATANTIQNTVSAQVGNSGATTTNTQLTSNNAGQGSLVVKANDNAGIIGAAGIAALAFNKNAVGAVGVAVANNSIANQVTADVNGGLIRADNVQVQSQSTSGITTVAVGVAFSSGGLATGAGSVATSLLGTNVDAHITGGADVIATNNALVSAANTDSAQVYAGAFSLSGGAAGAAGSVVTSVINGGTAAYISGANTKVDALGTSSTGLSVNSGQLVNAIDLGAFAAPSISTPNFTETQQTVRGLAVVASSHQAVVTNVASVAAAKNVAIMINPITNVMEGSTQAYIDSASIDTRLTSSTLKPQIVVGADSYSYSGAFGLGIAIATGDNGAAGGATIVSTAMERATIAFINNATVGTTVGSTPAVGSITVRSNAEQDGSSIAAGFDSGSAAINVFSALTSAYVDGGTTTAGTLTVTANDGTGIAAANGSLAYGTAVAIGAAFVVQVSSNTTLAYIGDQAHYESSSVPSNSTTLQLGGALDVEAHTTDNFKAISVGGALAAGKDAKVAVAGMANVEIGNNTTIAGIYDTSLTSPTGSGSAGAVTVNATNTVNIFEIAGGLAVAASGGGVGIGASANVIVFESQTTAETRNSNLSSSAAINVNASGQNEVTSYAVTAGVGGSVGIGAAVGVILIGTNTADSDTLGKEQGQLNQNNNGTLTAVNASTSTPQSNGGVPSSTPGAASNTPTATYNVSSVLTGGNDGVTAQIAGGNVTGTSVNVNASSTASVQAFVLGAGFGKNAGVGAGIAYVSVDSTVLANLNAIVTTPTINVTASAGDAGAGPTVNITSVAGAGALYFAGDAAIALGNVSNVVHAEVGGSLAGPANNAPAVTISATDTSTQSNTAGGGALAGAAVGVSFAQATKSSAVTADILPNSAVNASTVSLNASSSGDLSATAVAVAGGGAALNGAIAISTEGSTVVAQVGAGSTITALNLTAIATDTPQVEANALGVAVAASAGAGASVATATDSATVSAAVQNNVDLSNVGGVSLQAYNKLPSSGDTTYANAIGATGGFLLGLNATVATASATSDVSATIGNSVILPFSAISLVANNTTSENANGLGISAGLLAVGVVVVNSTASTKTTAALGNNDTMPSGIPSSTAPLTISAIGTDTTKANAVSGSGGVVAGSGAAASTSDTATVKAGIGDNSGTLYVKSLNINASHTDNYATQVNTVQAAVVGASGATANHTSNSTVTAGIGVGDTIIVLGHFGACTVCVPQMSITASNNFDEIVNGDSATGGAGGVLIGAAVLSTINLGGTSTINIGSGTNITSGSDPINNPGNVFMLASSSIVGNDSVSLTTGGLLAGSGVNSALNATVENDINIGAPRVFFSGSVGTPSTTSPVTIFSFGTVGMGTYTSTNASTASFASTYGLASVAAANASTIITTNQNIVVGASTITGFNGVNVTAGQDPTGGTITSMTDDARAASFVIGLVAVPTANATTTLTNNTSVVIGKQATLDSGGDVTLGGYDGFLNPTATGSAHGFELGFIPVSGGSGNRTPIAKASLTVDGTVVAGVFNNLVINIACTNAASCFQETGSGVPVVASYNPNFNASDFINNTPGLTDVSTALLLGVPSTASSAFAIGSLYASGGSVTLNADSIGGGGKITANGSPIISVNNPTNASLILSGGAFIPSAAFGQVVYTGAAKSAASSLAINSNPAGTPTISINNSFVAPAGGFGPELFVIGDITNVNGLVTINNTTGSYGLTANLTAQQINITVPNGVVAISANGPGGIYFAGGSPFSEWQSFMTFPGGNPLNTVNPNANIAAAYLANFVADCMASLACTQLSNVNPTLYAGTSQSSNGKTVVSFFGGCIAAVPSSPGANCSSGAYLNWPGAVSTSQGYSYDSSISVAYPFILSFPLMTSTNASQSVAQQYASANLTGSQASSQIFGGIVLIKANIIDIDGLISVGRTTNYFINIDSSLTNPSTNGTNGGLISNFQYNYNQTVATNPGADPTLNLPSPSATIAVTYNAATKQINVSDINASSGGAYLLLDGQIIATNLLGNIKVNSSYGNVTVSNQTNLDLVVNSINVGNSQSAAQLTSTVKIVDRAKSAQTTTYKYSPVTNEVDVYLTSSGADPSASATPSAVFAGPTANYQPLGGLRYQWTQTARIQYDPNGTAISTNGALDPSFANSNWVFEGANPASPWQYVSSADGRMTNVPQGILITPTAAFTGALSPYAPIGGTTGPGLNFNPVSGPQAFLEVTKVTSGTLAVGETISTGTGANKITGTIIQSFSAIPGGIGLYVVSVPNITTDGLVKSFTAQQPSNLPVFQESITGILNGTVQNNINYANGVPGFPDGTKNTVMNITSGQLYLTSSVKADNPFAITFDSTANVTGAINITSAGNVILNGKLTNPSGSTSVGASQVGIGASLPGSVTQTYSGSIVARDLNLSANGSLGTAAQPLSVSVADKPTADLIAAGFPYTLSAIGSDAGVYLNLSSGATIRRVVASNFTTNFGDVNITATGNLLDMNRSQASGGLNAPGVVGNNINLISTNGSVGSLTDPLPISANATLQNDGSYRGGVVNVAAQGDIALTQTAGVQNFVRVNTSSAIPADLRVGLIASTAGNVLLNVSNGSIVQANAQTAAQTLSAAQLQAVSQTLHLTGLDGANDNAMASVIAFDNQVNRNLNLYSTLLKFGTVTNGAFVLNSDATTIALYAPQAALSLGIPLGQVTTQQVQNYAANQYAAYGNLFAQAYGANWQTNTQVTNYLAWATLNDFGGVSSGVFVLSNTGVQNYAANALSSVAYTTFNNLVSNGSVSPGGQLTLNNTGIVVNAAGALSSTDYTTFNSLVGKVTVSNGQLTLANGSVSASGQLTLNDSGIAANAARALSSADYTTFNNLVGNGTVSNGQLTLNTAGVTLFTPAAASALGIPANQVTPQQVQVYATALYQADATKIQTSASGLYQANATTIQTYAAALYQTDATTIRNYGNTQYGALKGVVTFDATPGVAYALLNASGTLKSSVFVLSSAGILNYSSDALSANDYKTFRSLVTNGTVGNDGKLTLNAAGIQLFTSAAATALNVSSPTDAQVQQYANSVYQTDAIAIQSFANNQYHSLTANGTPQVSQGILGLVSNAVYTQAQVIDTLNSSALLSSAAVVGNSATATIVGSNVTLNATGNIGSSAPNVVIGLTDLLNGTLTSAQQAALSVATTPGTVTFDGVDANGKAVTGLVLGSLPAGITAGNLKSVELAQISPVFVFANGTFNANAGGKIYVQSANSAQSSAPDLTLGQIKAGGDVTLLSPQSILTARSTSSPFDPLFADQIVINPVGGATGNLTLAANGSIASQRAPLSYVAPGTLLSATAGGSAYLAFDSPTSADAMVGKLFAGGTIFSFTATGRIVPTLPGVTIAANIINLITTGDLGSSAVPFEIQLGTGYLGAQIHNGSAYIYAPTLTGQTDNTLRIGGLFADNSVSLLADAGVAINGLVSATNGAVSVSGTSITMGPFASISGPSISLVSTGNVVLGELLQGPFSSSVSGNVISVIAGGSITANGDGQPNIVAALPTPAQQATLAGAGNPVVFLSGSSISLGQVTAGTLKASAVNDLTLNSVNVLSQINLAAANINVNGSQIPSTPSIPLHMTVTGYNGGVAKVANVNIDPDVIIIDQLNVADIVFNTNAPTVTIQNGFVQNQMLLTTSVMEILMNNNTSAPMGTADVQFYSPTGNFTLNQVGTNSITTVAVVQVQPGSGVLINGAVFVPASAIDVTPLLRFQDTPDSLWFAQKDGADTFYLLGQPGGSTLDRLQLPQAVQVVGDGPAVNIEGLKKLKKLLPPKKTSSKSAPGQRSSHYENPGNTAKETLKFDIARQ